MKKYLTSYQTLENDEWQYYITEVNLTELICLLEKVVNDSINVLFITFNPRRAATPIKKDTAKALLAILSVEQNHILQKTLDEFYAEHDN